MNDMGGQEGPRTVEGIVIGERTYPITGRLFFGIAMVMFGALWTLQNLGWEPAGELVHWWPVLLLAYGVLSLTGTGATRSVVRGGFFVGAGVLLLAAHLAHVSVGFGVLWALFILFAGIMLVRRSLPVSGATPAGEAAGDNIRLFAVMGAAISRVAGQPVRRGELYAVMGGVELDLRESKPVTDRVVIEVLACAGGIEIAVPETWRVESEIMPIAGGFENRTMRADDGPPACTLVLRGMAIMGGVIVRNQPTTNHDVHIMRRRRRGGVEEVHVSPFGVSVIRGGSPPAAGGAPPPAAPPPPVEPN